MFNVVVGRRVGIFRTSVAKFCYPVLKLFLWVELQSENFRNVPTVDHLNAG